MIFGVRGMYGWMVVVGCIRSRVDQHFLPVSQYMFVKSTVAYKTLASRLQVPYGVHLTHTLHSLHPVNLQIFGIRAVFKKSDSSHVSLNVQSRLKLPQMLNYNWMIPFQSNEISEHVKSLREINLKIAKQSNQNCNRGSGRLAARFPRRSSNVSP